MGHCITSCNNNLKGKGEFNIRNIFNGMTPEDYIEKVRSGPNYPTIIFLQMRIKKFLKKKKLKFGQNQNTNAKNANNINVNINLNVNMNNNQQINRVENKTEQNPPPNNSNIVIPAVKAELKESLIFSNDAFLKKMQTKSSNVGEDPRNQPFNGQRMKYPKIVEENSAYEGEWKNGKRDGLGILSWKDVSKFIGNFIEDKVMGFGKLWHEDGDVYTGFWNDFQADGIGIYKTNAQASYEGYWKNDKQNGVGVEKWPRGSSYIGEYQDGNKEGIGSLNFEGNGGFEGEFKGGCISGVGVFFFSDNRRYEGEWKNNKMHGYGMITWPEGKFYEGEFCDDKKEGFGIFYSLRKIYMGMWHNSSLEGDTIIIEGHRVKKQYWENGRAVRNLPADKPIFFEKYVDEIIKFKEERDKALNINTGQYY